MEVLGVDAGAVAHALIDAIQIHIASATAAVTTTCPVADVMTTATAPAAATKSLVHTTGVIRIVRGARVATVIGTPLTAMIAVVRQRTTTARGNPSPLMMSVIGARSSYSSSLPDFEPKI